MFLRGASYRGATATDPHRSGPADSTNQPSWSDPVPRGSPGTFTYNYTTLYAEAHYEALDDMSHLEPPQVPLGGRAGISVPRGGGFSAVYFHQRLFVESPGPLSPHP